MPLYNPPIAGASTFASDITAQAHILTSTTTPTVANGASNGTSPAAPTISGTDDSGVVTFSTGTTPALGSLCIVTYGVAYSGTPKVVLEPLTSASTQYKPYVSAYSNTGFTISFASSPAASTNFTFSYHVLG